MCSKIGSFLLGLLLTPEGWTIGLNSLGRASSSWPAAPYTWTSAQRPAAPLRHTAREEAARYGDLLRRISELYPRQLPLNSRLTYIDNELMR